MSGSTATRPTFNNTTSATTAMALDTASRPVCTPNGSLVASMAAYTVHVVDIIVDASVCDSTASSATIGGTASSHPMTSPSVETTCVANSPARMFITPVAIHAPVINIVDVEVAIDVVDIVDVAIDVVDIVDVAINVVECATASRGPPGWGPGPDPCPGLFMPAHTTAACGMADLASDCPGAFAAHVKVVGTVAPVHAPAEPSTHASMHASTHTAAEPLAPVTARATAVPTTDDAVVPPFPACFVKRSGIDLTSASFSATLSFLS